MEPYLLWAIAGLVLVIAELMTGTFYLLVLGIAALCGALIAWVGGNFWLQVIVVSAATVAGWWAVRHYRAAKMPENPDSAGLEVGQTVVLESWTDQASGMARVSYRGSGWDAKVTGSAKAGDVLHITALQGGVLQVKSTPSN